MNSNAPSMTPVGVEQNSNDDFDVGGYEMLEVSDNKTLLRRPGRSRRSRTIRKERPMSHPKKNVEEAAAKGFQSLGTTPHKFGSSNESIPVPQLFGAVNLTPAEQDAANKAKASGANWLTIFTTILAAIQMRKPILEGLLELLKNLQKPTA